MNKIEVGKIVTTQGIKGEIRVKFNSGLNEMFNRVTKVFIEKDEYTVEKFRQKGSLLIIKLKEVNHIDEAEKIVGKYLFVEKKELKLKFNEIVIEEIIGFDAFFNNENLGKILKIDTMTSAQGLFILDNEVMIPMHSNFLKQINYKKKLIIFKNLEGLI